MGGSSYDIPPAPQPQTMGQSAAEYAEALPKIYDVQKEYLPQFAQQAKDISEELYPTTSRLQEQIAGMAEKGMREDVPDWMQEQYLSGMRAQLGENVKSGIGAGTISRGLMSLKKNWQDYYTNLALQASGRQGMVQAPSYGQMYGGFTPGAGLSYSASTYGPQMSGYNTRANIGWKQSQMSQMKPFMYMQGVGNLLQGGGSAMAGMGAMK